MAAGNNNNAIYYNISDGKICRQFKEANGYSKSRVNKNGKTVHEVFYDYLDGLITGITTKDSDYGKFWLITLKDGESNQVLQFNYSSGYANAFLKSLPNVNLNEIVKIIPNLKMEGDKKKTTVFITQHGTPVKWYYTKEQTNGLPPLVKKKVKGKEVWDDSDSMEFLEKMVNEKIIPKLPKGGLVADEVDGDLEAEAQAVKDKLPF